MNLMVKTIKEHGDRQIEKRRQEQNKPQAENLKALTAPETFLGIEDVLKRDNQKKAACKI